MYRNDICKLLLFNINIYVFEKNFIIICNDCNYELMVRMLNL